MPAERLQKILARAGVASRRLAEQIILAGQVSVNGRIVTELGTKADAASDDIRYNGRPLRAPAAALYLALHKPAGCVATMHDPEGRETIADFLRGVPGRVFPVGRLDYHTAGLLLLTNDGEWANRLMKAPQLEQVYAMKVKGALDEATRARLERKTGARLRATGRGDNAWYEVTLAEARRDLVRRMMAQAGHPVEKIRRVRIGNIELASLPPGRYRLLAPDEVRSLSRQAAGERAVAEAAGKRRRGHGGRPARMRAGHRKMKDSPRAVRGNHLG